MVVDYEDNLMLFRIAISTRNLHPQYVFVIQCVDRFCWNFVGAGTTTTAVHVAILMRAFSGAHFFDLC